MSCSENIQRFRKRNNLSQEKLAELLNVSRQAVTKWESGQCYPDISKLITLSELFNVTIDKLVKGEKYDNCEPRDKLV